MRNQGNIDKHVFVDWDEIEAGYGTEWPPIDNAKVPKFMPYGIDIAVHKPILEDKPVFYPEMPWESFCINGGATFIKDEDKYRLWYECFGAEMLEYESDNQAMLAYAESYDGVNWTRPLLNLVEYHGSKSNNLIMNIHGTNVIKDMNAPEKERYKLVYMEADWPLEGQYSRILGATSPDGINWSKIDDPILYIPADTQTIIAFDENIVKYVLYTRQTYENEKTLNSWHLYCRRGISRSESENFTDWHNTEMVITNNPNDPVDWDYYNNGYMLWPDAKRAHLMLISMYHRTKDKIDIHLAVSRDGKIWSRPLGREAWIENGYPGSFNDTTMYAVSGIVPAGKGKWAVFVQCSRNGHNTPIAKYEKPYGGYWRAIIREDGFTSLKAEEIGECWTIPFKAVWKTIEINAVIPYDGFIKVGIVDARTGESLEGYDVEDCDPMQGDILSETVTWKGRRLLPQNVNCNCRLHLKLFKADLFAYSFVK